MNVKFICSSTHRASAGKPNGQCPQQLHVAASVLVKQRLQYFLCTGEDRLFVGKAINQRQKLQLAVGEKALTMPQSGSHTLNFCRFFECYRQLFNSRGPVEGDYRAVKESAAFRPQYF